MSELIQNNSGNFRWQLLTTASALALIGYISISSIANAADGDRPTVWIELGGLLDHVGEYQDPYLPGFTSVAVDHGLMSADTVQGPPRYGVGGQAGISFEPKDSVWNLSAVIRYGRSNSDRHKHQQFEVPPVYVLGTILQPFGPNHNSPISQTADYTVRNEESHLILDFNVGKDVGLGMQGNPSHIAFGVRFAHFTTKSNVNLLADPYPHLGYTYFAPVHTSLPINPYYQLYKAKAGIERDFRGIGPSLAWTGSVPLIDAESGDAKFVLDWGVNASLLIGRQKARIQHRTTGDIHKNNVAGYPIYAKHYTSAGTVNRSRSVVVPNIGGLAGLSVRFPSAKVSLGYRVDFFDGAMDAGIDARHSSNVLFHGPYASISIGMSLFEF